MNRTDQNWQKGQFRVEGMHCAGCAGAVNSVLSKVPGVKNADVNLATEKAFLVYDADAVSPETLKDAVDRAGYKLITEEEPADKLAAKRERDKKKLESAKRNLLISWIVTAPVMIVMALMLLFQIHPANPFVMEIVMVSAAVLVIFIPGRETLLSAWKSARSLNPNMDVLIAIGTVASLSTGLINLSGYLGLLDVTIHSFAGIGAMIMAFHLTGRYIEVKAKGHASDAITKLLSLEAVSARVIRDNREIEIPVGELVKGDVMIVRPGEKIPADGIVIDGAGTVNEAMVTGESMPVRKSTGDDVTGGTINEEGSIHVRAEKIGEEAFLNRVVRLVEEAQGSKVPIQEYADRITAVFVPVILLLSLVTFSVWLLFPDLFSPLTQWAEGFIPWVETGTGRWSQAFFAALAVLVIACPCALGLATPTALMSGTGLGAENGILIRHGEAIQRLQEATHFVFDKTGTLTEGKPEVTDFETTENDIGNNSQSELSILEAVYAVENLSEHPVSKAITRYAEQTEERKLKTDDFRSYPGLGVSGLVMGELIRIGNPEFMKIEGLQPDVNQMKRAEELEKMGKTVVFAARGHTVTTLIAVADTLKTDAAEMVRSLNEQGYKTVMLTGDNPIVAATIATRLSIDDVYAGIKPAGKADKIRELRESGAVVVMVGDGVNDAPSLAAADVGIAIGTGTDIAIESGSVVLVDGKPGTLLKAVNLSLQTFRKIKQNLFWASIYNVIMIPIAIAGLLHPVLAEAAMAFSSVNVVLNSRRISLD